MKKAVSLLLVLCMLVMSGCAVSEHNTTAAETTQEPTQRQTVRLTFPEGYSAVQIAQKLEKNGVCSAQDFMQQVNNIDQIGDVYRFACDLTKENKAFALEGYIFPDTYDFYIDESASRAISRFLSNADKKLPDEYYERAEELGYTMDEIIILASVIQKEAGIKAEMSKVSSVLHNRMTKPQATGGKLQCDVTINYVNDYITSSPYLDGDTSVYAEYYNTYKCVGLPSGAICNPGIDAIKAALYPEDTNYFFFVTDPEKNYYYAETWDEHVKNCRICGIAGY